MTATMTAAVAEKAPWRRVVCVETDDWVKVYLDGKFVDEGHSFNYAVDKLLELLGVRRVGVYLDPDVYEENLGDDEFFAQVAQERADEDVTETGIPLPIDNQI